MSDTPRTAKAWKALDNRACGLAYVKAEMEKLETELAAAISERDELKEQWRTMACPECATLASVTSQYDELLYAVERKFPGESRHQTALRYIQEREKLACEAGECMANAAVEARRNAVASDGLLADESKGE